jgi:hypothetical protein
VSVLTRVGLCLLAFGALTGWVVVLRTELPRVLERVGVRSPRRLLQAHVDYIVMGVILIAVGVALPDLAGWNEAVLIAGTVVNPTLFVPLAFREAWSKAVPYRIVAGLSFAAMGVGTVGAAVAGLGA